MLLLLLHHSEKEVTSAKKLCISSSSVPWYFISWTKWIPLVIILSYLTGKIHSFWQYHPGMQLERILKILKPINSELKLMRLNIEISCLQWNFMSFFRVEKWVSGDDIKNWEEENQVSRKAIHKISKKMRTELQVLCSLIF